MIFEWDDHKEQINIAKHGIDFKTAARVFQDEFRIEIFDELHSDIEERYITIGRIGGVEIIVMVVFTERKQAIRLISARKATAQERKMYQEIDFNEPLTDSQVKMLHELAERPVTPDEDCPELTAAQLSEFKKVSENHRAERCKQTVTLRLSPQALKKAKSLGKGYTSILSRILENALNNPDIIQHNL